MRARPRLGSIAVLVAVLTPIVAGSAVVVDREGASASRDKLSSCAASVEFRGRTYLASAVAGDAVSRDGPLGTGHVSPCTDVVRSPRERRRVGEPMESVDLVRLGDVDPHVAVGRRDQESFVYIVTGRCIGLDTARCITRTLAFGDGRYTATLPVRHLARSGLIGRGIVAAGRPSAEQVDVRALKGVNPTVAVAVGSEPESVYVAADACLVANPVEFITCLRRVPRR